MKRVASAHDAGAGGGANRGGCVEAIEDHTLFRHRIEVRSFYKRMTGEASVAVAMIVRHDEDDVRALVGLRKGEYE